MSAPATRILRRAAGEIGYSRWTDPNRGTKYARETQPVFWPKDTWLLANGISFCDIFVTWVFWKALGKSFVTSQALPAGASYNTDYRASKGGRVKKSQARPGDVLVFDWNWNTAATNHVGILEKRLASGNFQTIEGNTSTGSSGSQSNGGRVARRTRKPSQVRYVIRPVWSKAGVGNVAVSKPESKPAVTKDGQLVTDGRMGTTSSKALQRFLNDRISTRKLKIDGRLGPDTYRSLQEYLGHPVVDGLLEHQSYKPTELGNGIGPHGWGYEGRGAKGSKTVRRLQKWIGVGQDGVWYEGTTKALQHKLNAHGVGMG